MIWILVGVALLAGCDQLFGFDTVRVPDDALANDAPVPDAPPGFVCAGQYFQHCEPMAVIHGKDLRVPSTTPMMVNSDAAEGAGCDRVLQPPSGPAICALVVDTAEIDGVLLVDGTRPFAIYAMTSIRVTGSIDVSSDASGRRGAGGSDGSCMVNNGAPQLSPGSMYAGGGAGGSFADRGGAGGAGEGMVSVMSPPKVTGAFLLRGGCKGGDGGEGEHLGSPAPGGNGGGAVYLASGGVLTIAGSVLANGAGGAAGFADVTTGGDFQGGGGGGTGGVILLEGDVTVPPGGLLMAAGGGGGGGSYTTAMGTAGADPSPATPMQPASGGTAASGSQGNGGGGSIGSVGGDGFYGGDLGGGGGGGGGGPGMVRVPIGATVNGTVVP